MQDTSIMLDGHNLSFEKGTGVATYGRNLSRVLKQSGAKVSVLYGSKNTRSKDPLLSEIAFFDAVKSTPKGPFHGIAMVRDALIAPINCSVDTVPMSGSVISDSMKGRLPDCDVIMNSVDLYLRCARTFRWFSNFASVTVPGIDIAHWTYPLPIAASNALNVYTLHDLVPLRLPHTTLDNKRRYLKMCRKIAQSADHIVTVSEASKKDIVELLAVADEKVSNTYQSVSFPVTLTQKSDVAVADELKGIFGLDYKNYFLFFGAIEPKKNLGRLIEAYLGSGVPTRLVIVGAPGWKSEDELKLLDALKTLPASSPGRRKILQLDYLPLDLLVTMIRGAKATVFPSLYEGFGLPALESMLLGTAVITSNTSSLPEICGSAACLIDPYDTRSLSEAIKAIDTDENLRKDLEAKGRLRAKLFDEKAYSERLTDVYARVARNKRQS